MGGKKIFRAIVAETNVLNMRETVRFFYPLSLRFARLKKKEVFKIA
jgi:hypothetical protein